MQSMCYSCFHRTSLFIGFHKHLVYAVDCFAHERVVNMDVSYLNADSYFRFDVVYIVS